MRWVIGDVHGMLRPLDAVLGAVGARDPSPQFVFVGDYVNRGPDSRGVIERLRSMRNAACLRGNHDDVFDLILHGDSYVVHRQAPDSLSAFLWFVHHGFANTMQSYGVQLERIEDLVRRPSPQRLRDALESVPQSHREFIQGLMPVMEYPDAFVAHGMWDVDEPDMPPGLHARLMPRVKLRHRTLWGRYTAEEIRGPKAWERTGYFGHTPVSNYVDDGGLFPIGGPRIVLLDTGAALGGRLSAVCIETSEVVQADLAGTVFDARDG